MFAVGAWKYDVVPITRGRGIELGRGPYKGFPHWIAVRTEEDQRENKFRADYPVRQLSRLDDFEDGSLDFVVVLPGVDEDVLEKIRHEAIRLLRVGGYYVTNERDGTHAYKRREPDNENPLVWEANHSQPIPYDKTVCVVRHGAIGDALQAVSILPELKRQGYHVTMMCEPTGEEILRHDPHIDSFWIQDKDQVPNQELAAYWAHVSKRFDKFVNLSESVEGTLITLPGRANHGWPFAVRQKYCNKNYLEFTAELAELPFHPEHHFYPSAEETHLAMRRIDNIRSAVNDAAPAMSKTIEPFVVMWALAGSSVHKFYPHQDPVIAKILTDIPQAHVILVGDYTCKLLEAGWENESRVHRLSGEISVRDTLALAQLCQLVIGPETGVLNAVAFEKLAKICLLSHSSEENLTKHWVNTEAIASKITPCYPCHRLHYTRDFCPEDKPTGASQCQAEIRPSNVYAAVNRAFVGWSTVRAILEV